MWGGEGPCKGHIGGRSSSSVVICGRSSTPANGGFYLSQQGPVLLLMIHSNPASPYTLYIYMSYTTIIPTVLGFKDLYKVMQDFFCQTV